MAYTKQSWADGVDGNTPITAIKLLHIENGIEAAQSPSWVLTTLAATLASLGHPITLMVTYSSGWTINSTLQANANFAWHFVGGTSGTPPPSTTGPQVWDHS